MPAHISGLHVDERVPLQRDAPMVVLVHGSMDRGRSLALVDKRLSDLRVITYDRRGYNRSRHAMPLATTLFEHVEDLLSVIDGRYAVVAGHSYGGAVALAGACRSPELIRAVVAYEAPTPWMSWWPRRSAGRGAAGAPEPEEAAESFMRRMIGDARWDRLPQRTRDLRRSEGAALVAEMSSLHADGAPFDPARISVPTVIARGERSLPHHRRSAEELAAVVPGAELVDVEGAGHDAHLSRPDAFAGCVRRALERARPWPP